MSTEQQPTIDGLSIVLVGSFNPAIFQPWWFSANGLIRPEEAKGAEIEIVHPQATAFRADWLQINVTTSRVSFDTFDPAKMMPLKDLAIGTISVLEHSPIRMFGLNRFKHFGYGSDDELEKFTNKFISASDWPQINGSPSLKSVSVEFPPFHAASKRLRIKVELSNRIQSGVFVHVNQHFEPESDDKESENRMAMDLLFSVLENDWLDLQRFAEDSISQIVELK